MVGGGGDGEVTPASGQAGGGGGLDEVLEVGIGARGLGQDPNGLVSNGCVG